MPTPCSARTGAGVDDLLRIMANLCPSPPEGNPRPFLLRQNQGDAEEVWHAEPDASKEVVAHVFKVTTDQFVGKLALVRVHQGTVTTGSQLFLNDSKKPLGSRVDRHEHIGRGEIGEAGFRNVLSDPVLGRLPGYLETEKGEDPETGRDWDAINLEVLRSLGPQAA